MAGPKVDFSAPTPVVNGNGDTDEHIPGELKLKCIILHLIIQLTKLNRVAAAYSANPDDIEIIKT
jgi:hypothetical protein